MENEGAASRLILSTVEEYASSEAFQQSPHLFSADPDALISQLKELIDSTTQISSSLNAHSTLPLSNPKLLSLFRQQTAITHTVHAAAQTVKQMTATLRKRMDVSYGEDIPLETDALSDWCTARFETWGKLAGMEAFKEEQRDGRITIMLGGKVIVIDMEFTVERLNASLPLLKVTNVKTSFAVPNGTSAPTSSGSTSLDGLLIRSLTEFLAEVQKDPDVRDPEEAARIGERISDCLKYLMKLDLLALHEGDGGLRWFNSCDLLSLTLENYASLESSAIEKDLSLMSAPLDVFLMRGHALPLPYLTVPALSFLIHVSPKAYLTMLRYPTEASASTPATHLPRLDIPFTSIRSYSGAYPRMPGIAVASLVLCPGSSRVPQQPEDLAMDVLATRPTFPLAPVPVEAGDHFAVASTVDGQTPGEQRYFLDFTDGSRSRGIVMSQTRMHEIETVIHPLSGMDQMDGVQPLMHFASGSWIDMLLNPGSPIISERYTSLLVSPTSMHPPLQLRLTAPEEPGFILEKVPVRNMKEVWAVLEIVREQCWLNEALLTCQWLPEALSLPSEIPELTDIGATEDELQAVLGGIITPRSIPVNVSVPTPVPENFLFDPTMASLGMVQNSSHQSTRIVMSSPERSTISGLVETTVAYDNTRSRGVSLSVKGAMGADLDVNVLEEVCRRGGLLGLPGRIWGKSHGLL
ncbi:hypothetical protein BDW22DRAFT_1407766 [Trametopsis cervina]|nr:hypothetical protein BDW22DRAFT_1407766 [Trametopsis cervina]